MYNVHTIDIKCTHPNELKDSQSKDLHRFQTFSAPAISRAHEQQECGGRKTTSLHSRTERHGGGCDAENMLLYEFSSFATRIICKYTEAHAF